MSWKMKNGPDHDRAVWRARNSSADPAEAEKRGGCWNCGGTGRLYWTHMGEHGAADCPTCRGTGKKR